MADHDSVRALLTEAGFPNGFRIVADDVAGMPLFRLINFWATRAGVIYEARPDQRTVATSARLAVP